MSARKIFIGAVAVVAAVAATNFFRVNSQVRAAVAGRDFMSAAGYYRYGVDPNNIVFDLRDLTAGASGAGVLGGFFQFAEEMQDRDFDYVYLAYHGHQRFRLAGDDFKEIGESFSYQNPVYLVRTLPEKLETPDGRRAFSSWSGGLLGVLGAQMDDVNALTRKWWLEDELNSY